LTFNKTGVAPLHIIPLELVLVLVLVLDELVPPLLELVLPELPVLELLVVAPLLLLLLEDVVVCEPLLEDVVLVVLPPVPPPPPHAAIPDALTRQAMLTQATLFIRSSFLPDLR
jgi:hypothetical protein